MGHRFQARQQTIETGQEGVHCGFMGNNIYPRSCIELWVWVILIDSGWRKERLILCSGFQQLHKVFSFRLSLGLIFFSCHVKMLSNDRRWLLVQGLAHGLAAGSLAFWTCSFFCFFWGC